MPATEMETRKALYAKLSIARKQLGMQDEDYRAVLERLTGHRSARDCSIPEMEKVLAEFRTKGFRARRATSQKPFVRKIYAMWKDMAPFLKCQGSEKGLRSFVQRQTTSRSLPNGVTAPEFLDAVQANRVIEGLKDWRRRLEGDVA